MDTTFVASLIYVITTSMTHIIADAAMDYNDYASYYPSLLGHDPRTSFYNNLDHRRFYCDCKYVY
jgi:hypothetical protein